jgi:uncharacterized protein YeaO (DUF488 family)
MDIRLKRVYAAPAAEDGCRVLVDRLWPRGLSKEAAAIDLWAKEVAPTAGLRRWFGHEPAKWGEFGRRYRQELKDNREALEPLRRQAAKGRMTLVFAAKDEEHNQAVVLKAVLEG